MPVGLLRAVTAEELQYVLHNVLFCASYFTNPRGYFGESPRWSKIKRFRNYEAINRDHGNYRDGGLYGEGTTLLLLLFILMHRVDFLA